jgi:hypothetical protein
MMSRLQRQRPDRSTASHERSFTGHGRLGNAALKTLLITLASISALGLGLWAWMQQNKNILPPPDSRSGSNLLSQYQELTHQIWLIILLIAAGYLIRKFLSSRQREAYESSHSHAHPFEAGLRFIRNNPITTALFIAYTVAMIAGTTYLYKDMVGWYPDLTKGYFLDNFAARESLLEETMRRTDYRFFPLAHQDLHILSWFTIHIKTWMLFSAGELAGIVLLSTKFLNSLGPKKVAKQSAILLLTLLFFIHPSTGTAFFHLIYCERLLCLIFTLYITSYLSYRKTNQISYFYLTLLWALLGIYIKDIAIVLFVTPAACLWLEDCLKHRSADQSDHQLEHWLCSLSLVFVTSYLFLALIPSSFAGESAYNDNASRALVLDLRCYLFGTIALARAWAILQRRITFSMLDAINLTAVAYATALGITYAFDANSYLALPFQLVATINLGWAWIQLIETNQRIPYQQSIKITAAASASALIIGTDHTVTRKNFTQTITVQKADQASTQATYEKLDRVSRTIRESGNNINLIISQDSSLSAKRHLNRIPYRSLIEYEPERKQFIVKDGANKGMIYTPKKGDIVANIDKNVSSLSPILKNLQTELIYRHNPSERSGVIRRVTNIEPSSSNAPLPDDKLQVP